MPGRVTMILTGEKPCSREKVSLHDSLRGVATRLVNQGS